MISNTSTTYYPKPESRNSEEGPEHTAENLPEAPLTEEGAKEISELDFNSHPISSNDPDQLGASTAWKRANAQDSTQSSKKLNAKDIQHLNSPEKLDDALEKVLDDLHDVAFGNMVNNMLDNEQLM